MFARSARRRLDFRVGRLTLGLAGPDEREAVCLGYMASGAEIPLDADYLEGAHVIAVRKAGLLVGGYVIKQGPDLRCFSFIPDAARASIALDPARCAEISAFWMSRDLGWVDRWAVYSLMQVHAALLTDADWVLSGTRSPKLARRNAYVYHRRVWIGRNARSSTGARFLLFGCRRTYVLPMLLVSGLPRIGWLQAQQARARSRAAIAPREALGSVNGAGKAR